MNENDFRPFSTSAKFVQIRFERKSQPMGKINFTSSNWRGQSIVRFSFSLMRVLNYFAIVSSEPVCVVSANSYSFDEIARKLDNQTFVFFCCEIKVIVFHLLRLLCWKRDRNYSPQQHCPARTSDLERAFSSQRNKHICIQNIRNWQRGCIRLITHPVRFDRSEKQKYRSCFSGKARNSYPENLISERLWRQLKRRFIHFLLNLVSYIDYVSVIAGAIVLSEAIFERFWPQHFRKLRATRTIPSSRRELSGFSEEFRHFQGVFCD